MKIIIFTTKRIDHDLIKSIGADIVLPAKLMTMELIGIEEHYKASGINVYYQSKVEDAAYLASEGVETYPYICGDVALIYMYPVSIPDEIVCRFKAIYILTDYAEFKSKCAKWHLEHPHPESYEDKAYKELRDIEISSHPEYQCDKKTQFDFAMGWRYTTCPHCGKTNWGD